MHHNCSSQCKKKGEVLGAAQPLVERRAYHIAHRRMHHRRMYDKIAWCSSCTTPGPRVSSIEQCSMHGIQAVRARASGATWPWPWRGLARVIGYWLVTCQSTASCCMAHGPWPWRVAIFRFVRYPRHVFKSGKPRPGDAIRARPRVRIVMFSQQLAEADS